MARTERSLVEILGTDFGLCTLDAGYPSPKGPTMKRRDRKAILPLDLISERVAPNDSALMFNDITWDWTRIPQVDCRTSSGRPKGVAPDFRRRYDFGGLSKRINVRNGRRSWCIDWLGLCCWWPWLAATKWPQMLAGQRTRLAA
jgi:hypothetical protein